MDNMLNRVEKMSLKDLSMLRETANAEYEKRQQCAWNKVVEALTDYMSEFGNITIIDAYGADTCDITAVDNFDKPGWIS